MLLLRFSLFSFGESRDINESPDKFTNLFHSRKGCGSGTNVIRVSLAWKRELDIVKIYDNQHGYVCNLCNGVAKSASESKNRAPLWGLVSAIS